MNKFYIAIAMAALVLLSACAAGLIPQSIDEKPLVRVATIGKIGLFAATSDGARLALSKSGLYLSDLESASSRKISSSIPVALAWSPDDLTLAAASALADYETRLSLYSAEGHLLQETLLPIAATKLVWSARGDLLVTGLTLKVYSFGGNLRQLLYRIGDDEVVETLLSDSTLRPSLVTQVKSELHDLLPVAFSPNGDEIVFQYLHDPPEFPPYLQLIYRNWQSIKERPLQKMPLQAVDLAWHSTADSIDIFTQRGFDSQQLWTPAEPDAGAATIDAYRFSEGKLYRGDERLVDWGPGAQLQRLADGSFFLSSQKSLYLGKGLQSVPAVIYDEKEWHLRRWRYDGLITQVEYQRLLKEKD